MLSESVEHLDLRPGAVVVDGTLGGGGHAAAILDRTSPDGILIGLDLDADAISAASAQLARFGDRLLTCQSSFRNMDEAVQSLGHTAVDAVLLDLGVSSHQIDSRERGFRFGDSPGDVPLDMRMDQGQHESALGLLMNSSSAQLERWFRDYGELRGSRRLARAIEDARKTAPLETAADLLQIIRNARVGGGRKHNPATLVFQALRIAVNDELEALRDGLAAAIAIVKPGGRIAVIAYHSLEDRIVKQTFRSGAKGCECPPKTPVCICGLQPTLELVTKRPIRPTEAEVADNPRARSALLRVATRIAEAA
jgi:16S rRNA (cytosine1402-N4)-methyltransferase